MNGRIRHTAAQVRGYIKAAATRIGVEPDEYLRLRRAGMKHCSDCKRWLDLDKFSPSRLQIDGRHGQCRECAARRSSRMGLDRTETDRPCVEVGPGDAR